VEGYPEHPLPPLAEIVDLYERASLPLRPARVEAIALNTAELDDEQARAAVDRVRAETGLAADDPVRFGAGPLLDAVLDRIGVNASRKFDPVES
jgi:D-glutamate N-acetyltransferase